jgi:hypothetical protein
MLKSCGIEKKDFSNSKETINWVNAITSIITDEKDVRDDVKEYVTTKSYIVTSDDTDHHPDGCVSLDTWHEIMLRDIAFDSEYLSNS